MTKYKTVEFDSGSYRTIYVMGAAAERPPEKPRQRPQRPEEPKAERFNVARLRAILALPEAQQRRRQAVALATETRCSPAEARAILARLPSDAAAKFPHGGTLFPSCTVPLDEEGARIAAILKCAEAEGRERAALELALDTAMPLDQVRAVLSHVALEAEAPRIPTIAERSKDDVEIGGSFDPAPRRGASGLWDKAVATANASFTGGPKPPPPPPPPPLPFKEESK